MVLIHIYLTTRYQGKMSEGQQLTQELLKMTLTCPLSLFYENPWQTALSEQEKEDNLSSTWKKNKWHSVCKKRLVECEQSLYSLSTREQHKNWLSSEAIRTTSTHHCFLCQWVNDQRQQWWVLVARMASLLNQFLHCSLVILKIFSQIETTGSLKASGVCGWA